MAADPRSGPRRAALAVALALALCAPQAAAQGAARGTPGDEPTTGGPDRPERSARDATPGGRAGGVVRRGAREVPPEDDRVRPEPDGRERPHRRRYPRTRYLYIERDAQDEFDRHFRSPPRAAPAEPEPAPEPAPEEAGPPDPARPGAHAFPRGAAAPASGYAVGDRLPEDRPHVTLDWRTYGLPEPPAGQIYARVGDAVLLIESATRRVVARVEPETGD